MGSLIQTRERDPLKDPGKISAIDIAFARSAAADSFKEYGLGVPSYIIRPSSTEKLGLDVPGFNAIAGLTLTPEMEHANIRALALVLALASAALRRAAAFWPHYRSSLSHFCSAYAILRLSAFVYPPIVFGSVTSCSLCSLNHD